MALSTLQNDVSQFCTQLGLSGRLSLIERAWEAEMGSWGSMVKLVALDNAALVVETSSAPAMQEISMRRQELVRRMNRHFSSPFIRQIHVKVANP